MGLHSQPKLEDFRAFLADLFRIASAPRETTTFAIFGRSCEFLKIVGRTTRGRSSNAFFKLSPYLRRRCKKCKSRPPPPFAFTRRQPQSKIESRKKPKVVRKCRRLGALIFLPLQSYFSRCSAQKAEILKTAVVDSTSARSMCQSVSGVRFYICRQQTVFDSIRDECGHIV